MSVDEEQAEVLFRAKLQREDSSNWGFRLQGGLEYDTPLTLLKVFIYLSFCYFILFSFGQSHPALRLLAGPYLILRIRITFTIFTIYEFSFFHFLFKTRLIHIPMDYETYQTTNLSPCVICRQWRIQWRGGRGDRPQ